METAYNMVIGSSLAVLLALVVGMCVAGAWRHLTRQLTRGGLVVFLVGAGIATVEAQKLKAGYVDASVAESGDGSSWEKAVQTISELSGRMTYGGTVYVKPGEYTGDFMFPARYEGPHEQFSMIAVGGPEKTVIEGGSIFYMSEVLTLEWQCLRIKGFTLKALDSPISQALIEDCRLTGFADTIVWDSDISSCLIDNNTSGEDTWNSIEFCNLYNCTVVSNDTYSFGANVYNCIFWNNSFKPNYRSVLGWNDVVSCYTDDPWFVDEKSGDYRLRMGSPCVNAGDNAWSGSGTDLDGNERVQRSRVDIGCYEYQPTNEHQTITAPVPVEFAWIKEKCPEVLEECGDDYDKAVLMKSANPVDISLPEPLRTYYSIWESYVADLDPSDSNQTFRATIEMVDGEPIVKGDPESPNRKYTVLGKEKLSDKTWQENLPGAHFFKVKVGLK